MQYFKLTEDSYSPTLRQSAAARISLLEDLLKNPYLLSAVANNELYGSYFVLARRISTVEKAGRYSLRSVLEDMIAKPSIANDLAEGDYPEWFNDILRDFKIVSDGCAVVHNKQ
ncbi:MAG: hypothetical protein HUU54_05635 [Ignavibacteriaceae bacterium]|nr:hypothetical protein [Ignavibacteriaceae bacterium]